MSSKSIKPKQRLGMTSGYRRKRIITWVILAALGGAGLYGYRRYNEGTDKVEVPVAPQVPDVRIVKLAESGKPVHKGEVVVEFDAAQEEQNVLERSTTVRT